MKKIVALLAAVLLVGAALVGCAAGGAGSSKLKVGMVTDAGTIDDKSFNQGTWEGIQKAGKELGFEPVYLKPAAAQPAEADYLKEIQNLYDSGHRLIVTPGFKFSTAIYKAQDKYKDAKFVILDAAPTDENNNAKVGTNSVAIFFNEHESGFVAGVATALQVKDGKAGFVGGMQIPAVQKYNWGFQQGLKYANETYGTNVTIAEEDVVYQGTFTDAAAGQQLAATMFDRDVKVIFAAAGGVGIGVINEGVARNKDGKQVWVVGVDVDQYDMGFYDDAKTKSCILTSAMKYIDQASYDMVKAENDGKFPGGQTLTYSAANNGVGIPAKNPNLSDDTSTKVKETFDKLQKGEITVADKGDGLIEPAAK